MIAAGTRLGPYEVSARIGEGGMGEVYRARDSRLDRTVALKVLPSRFSSNPSLRERFEREARAISSLTHPHICTLYDIGSDDGVDFLVMEYLEGESLADRIERGPLPVEQVIRYGVEIAEALDKAHRANIVHRDLKPGNIMLTKSGAKLLDFGLAKFASNTPNDPNAATAAMTQQKPLTEEGSILGTFQYMAPEQVEGRDADPRTDLFALGAVLYEMATGKRAFEAKSRASLIASILDRQPPPISTIAPLTPRALERVVQMCLEKDPDNRWQSAHDVAAELKWIRDSSSETIGPGARRSRNKRLAQAGALVLAGVVAGGAIAWLAKRDAPPPRPVSRFTINTTPNAPLFMDRRALAISHDGTKIAYLGYESKKWRIYVRNAGSPGATPLAGTDRAHSPAFSPDGRWIAYLDNSGLKKIPASGGTPVRLARADESGPGVHWLGETIFYAPSFNGGLWSVHENGGAPKEIAKVDPASGVRALLWPHALPGGETVLATAWTGKSFDEARIVAYSLRDGTSRVVVDGGASPRYSPTGHLLYARGTNILAVQFDPKSLKVTGAPVTVATNVAYHPINGDPHFALADNGDMIFAAGGTIELKHTLVFFDRKGKSTPIVPTLRPYYSPVTSADAKTVALILMSVTYDIWLLEAERDVLTRVSFGGDDVSPTLSLDGRYVYWSSGRHGGYSLYRAPTDGTGGEELLLASKYDDYASSEAADHSFLIFNRHDKGQSDIWMLPLGTRQPRPVLATEHAEWAQNLSPDGRWLAYRSDESGQHEIYVRPVQGNGPKLQISIGGANGGGFTGDGREVIYRSGSKFYAVAIQTSPQLRASKPQFLFEDKTVEGRWDPTAGSNRILVIKSGPDPTTSQIEIVLNWAEELKRRVPTR
ncbi:MAG TPA: protein kinase [Thermoanaerobaculia bacterium]|nr:protein kinase [Thermoanaerobaculia bacterium]